MTSDATYWLTQTEAAGLKPLKIKGKTLLPIVQGAWALVFQLPAYLQP